MEKIIALDEKKALLVLDPTTLSLQSLRTEKRIFKKREGLYVKKVDVSKASLMKPFYETDILHAIIERNTPPDDAEVIINYLLRSALGTKMRELWVSFNVPDLDEITSELSIIKKVFAKKCTDVDIMIQFWSSKEKAGYELVGDGFKQICKSANGISSSEVSEDCYITVTLEDLKDKYHKLKEQFKLGIWIDKIVDIIYPLFRKEPLPIPRCRAGSNLLFISQKKEVFPCPKAYSLGKYRMGTIENLGPEFKTNRYKNFVASIREKCCECWAQYICGGCIYADSKKCALRRETIARVVYDYGVEYIKQFKGIAKDYRALQLQAEGLRRVFCSSWCKWTLPF